MNKFTYIVAVFLLPLLATACKRDTAQSNVTDLPDAVDRSDQLTKDMVSGEVVETMNASQYTYVCLDTGVEKIWAAGPVTEIEVGDRIGISTSMPNRDFYARSLDRTFAIIYFVSAFQQPDGTSRKMASHGMATSDLQQHTVAPKGADVGEIEKAEGGKTIAEIYAAKSDLVGKEVTFRGRVAKYTAAILRKNWLHVQDGSGDSSQGTHDLTVTTTTTAKVGDTVLVTGKLQLDKDFGHGYKYAMIVEDADVVVEE